MKKTILLLSLVLLLNSCGVWVRTAPDVWFNSQTTFALQEAPENDKSHTVPELKYQLATQGFNIVSIPNAEKALANPGKIVGQNKNNEIQEIYSIKDLNSVFMIVMDYRYQREDVKQYKDFHAYIYDMNTKKSVARVSWMGNGSVKTVMRKFAKKLVKLRLK